MNKKIMEVFNEYGFTYDGNYGHGFINEYEVNLFNLDTNLGPILMISTYLSQVNKSLFNSKINALKIKMLSTIDYPYGVAVMIGAVTAGAFLKNAKGELDQIFEVLESLEAPKKDICPVSGEELTFDNSREVNDKGLIVRITNDAIEAINNNIEEENKEFEQADNNYLKGFLGVVIGGVAGVVAAYIFSLLGLISSLSSCLSIWLGTLLYKKFGGKPNIVMVIMSFAVTILFMIGYTIFNYNGIALTLIEGLELHVTDGQAFNYCMNNFEEFSSAFESDLISTIIFSLIGTFVFSFNVIKSIKRPTKLD